MRMIPWLDGQSPFPDVSEALTEADGAPRLLAGGGPTVLPADPGFSDDSTAYPTG